MEQAMAKDGSAADLRAAADRAKRLAAELRENDPARPRLTNFAAELETRAEQKAAGVAEDDLPADGQRPNGGLREAVPEDEVRSGPQAIADSPRQFDD